MVRLLKKSFHAIARTNAMSRLVSRLETCADHRANLLRVLTYHRVDWPEACPHLYPGTLSATPAEFVWQMEYFARHYQVVDLQAVLDAIRGRRELPPKSLLITFDDAYYDFNEHAWPVLRKFSLPAIVFVPTAYVENRNLAFWWDRLYQASQKAGSLQKAIDRRRFRALVQQIKSLPHSQALATVDAYCQQHGAPQHDNHVMTWETLRRLAADGVDLAPHTRTHPLMTRISVEQAVDEARQSREDLRRAVGTDWGVLAYPAGACSRALLEPLREAGFEAAFTTQRGINDLASVNPLLLQRINISEKTSRTMLRAQLVSSMRYFFPLAKLATT